MEMEKNKLYGIQFDLSGRVIKENDIYKRQLTIAYEVHHLLHDENLSNHTRYILVSKLVRDWTTLNTVSGKYRNTPLWSEKALSKYQEIEKEHNGVLTSINNDLREYLIHEHILPVYACIKLFDTASPHLLTEDFVKFVLYNLLTAAVITKEENQIFNIKYKESMPDSFYKTENVLDRYTEVGIRLKRIIWSEGAKSIQDIKDIDPQKSILENELFHSLDDMGNSSYIISTKK